EEDRGQVELDRELEVPATARLRAALEGEHLLFRGVLRTEEGRTDEEQRREERCDRDHDEHRAVGGEEHGECVPGGGRGFGKRWGRAENGTRRNGPRASSDFPRKIRERRGRF